MISEGMVITCLIDKTNSVLDIWYRRLDSHFDLKKGIVLKDFV